MSYVFKIMAVMLALGVFVLGGCQTAPIYNIKASSVVESMGFNKNIYANADDKLVCDNWRDKTWASEAKRRGLDCGVDTNINAVNTTKTLEMPKKKLNTFLLSQLNHSCDGNEWLRINNRYVKETITFSKSKGLSCDVSLLPNDTICSFSNGIKLMHERKNILHYQNEAKRRGLDCGVYKKDDTVIASKPKITKPSISSSELDAERQKRKELERKLALLESKQKQEQKRINTDNQIPTISAFTKQNGSNATISGRVTDNTEVAEVLIDGEQLLLTNNGTFKTELYVPRNGLNVEIVAYDRKGNKASKLLKIERGNIQQANVQNFKSLDPSRKRVKSNPNALALIIGISDYENTKANALYADSDAKMFYDYANLKLGIPSSNIKELVNDKADRIDITRAIKSWLLKRTLTNKTDIYVFFAGHGLATDDGKDVYLLPYDGVPDLLEDSAIKRKELFADIQATKPRTVTVFLDTCYSGGKEMKKH